MVHSLINHLTWFHRQGFNTNLLPLESGHQDHSFLDQSVKDFEHGLDSILMHSTNTTELDASSDDAGAIPSSVSSYFLPQYHFW